jgi:hypothetical protein
MQISRNLTVTDANITAPTVNTAAWTLEQWKEAALHFARTSRELTFLWYGVNPTGTRELTTCVVLAQFDQDTPILDAEMPHIEQCVEDLDTLDPDYATLSEDARLDATFIQTTNRHRPRRHKLELIDTISLQA